jgi:predicted ArsR family transcriptional regulator
MQQQGNIDLSETSISAIEEKLLGVLKAGPLTRDQLVQQLHVPRTTIYDGLKLLIAAGEVEKYPVFTENQGRGRPRMFFALYDGADKAPQNNEALVMALLDGNARLSRYSIMNTLGMSYRQIERVLFKLRNKGKIHVTTTHDTIYYHAVKP